MDPSTWAGTIGAVGSCLTATALIITARADSRRSRRLESKVDGVQSTGEVTHKLVNHAHDVMVQEAKDNKDYQRALIRALEDRGIPIPIDQSAPPEPQADL